MMYNSRVKQLAYDLKKRGLTLEGALASLLVGRLSNQFNRKPKHVAQDLRVQFVSIGGRD
jgi:hypothetical protein